MLHLNVHISFNCEWCSAWTVSVCVFKFSKMKDQGFKILSAMTARGKPPHSRQGSLKRTAPALSRVCRVAQVTVGTSFGFGVLGLNSDSSPLSLWLGFSAVDLKKLRLS